MTTALALKDVCKLLGVQPYRIQHAYAVGAVQEPQTRISGRRVFEPADIKRLAKHFHVKIAAVETAAEPVMSPGASKPATERRFKTSQFVVGCLALGLSAPSNLLLRGIL